LSTVTLIVVQRLVGTEQKNMDLLERTTVKKMLMLKIFEYLSADLRFIFRILSQNKFLVPKLFKRIALVMIFRQIAKSEKIGKQP
jgi:hypothetical protein